MEGGKQTGKGNSEHVVGEFFFTDGVEGKLDGRTLGKIGQVDFWTGRNDFESKNLILTTEGKSVGR